MGNTTAASTSSLLRREVEPGALKIDLGALQPFLAAHGPVAVIDLETTFGNQVGEEGELDTPVVSSETAGNAELRKEKPSEPEYDADGNPIRREEESDDEEEQANMSLAAMEAALKPRVLETLDRIAMDYEELAAMQDNRISATLNEDGSFSYNYAFDVNDDSNFGSPVTMTDYEGDDITPLDLREMLRVGEVPERAADRREQAHGQHLGGHREEPGHRECCQRRHALPNVLAGVGRSGRGREHLTNIIGVRV